jgi:2-keto-4-pentenoate hydratase
MTTSEIAAIARRQLTNYDTHQRGRLFEDDSFRLTVDEAYAVQMQTASMRAARGEAIAGYKIGCVSEAVRRQLNLDRAVFGHLFATELYRSGVALKLDGFEGLAIEGEFAVRLAEDISDIASFLEHPERSIASVLLVIELHNNVFRRPERTSQELIANNALHAGTILPAMEGNLRSPSELMSERHLP